MGIMVVDDTSDDYEFGEIDTNTEKHIILPLEEEVTQFTPAHKQTSNLVLFEMDPSKFREEDLCGEDGSRLKEKFFDVFFELFQKGCIQLNVLNAEKIQDEHLTYYLRPKLWFK